MADFWNTYGGADEIGVRVFVGDNEIEEVSKLGDAILASYFPDPPGPFKRVAALLVAARLTPLFTLATANSTADNLTRLDIQKESMWMARVCLLLLGPAFSSIRLDEATNTHGNTCIWNGFPSLHSKAEFIFLLEWLRNFPEDVLTDAIARQDRYGRMVLAISLILEAHSYGQAAHRDTYTLCGACDKTFYNHCVEPIYFTFDDWLWQNWSKRHKQGAS